MSVANNDGAGDNNNAANDAQTLFSRPRAAAVWGPHYWFFLHTVAYTYPQFPNDTIKRKYYDFVSNLPLFIPNDEMSARFARILDEFPVSPYLGSRDAFVKWMFLVHDRYNALLGKEPPFASPTEAGEAYFAQYDDIAVLMRTSAPPAPPGIDSTTAAWSFWWANYKTPIVLFLLFMAVVAAVALSHRPAVAAAWTWPVPPPERQTHFFGGGGEALAGRIVDFKAAQAALMTGGAALVTAVSRAVEKLADFFDGGGLSSAWYRWSSYV